jgi:hypothetical protein
MERGTVTSFLPSPRSVTLGWLCVCILLTKETSEQRAFKGWSLTITPRFIPPFLPPSGTITYILGVSCIRHRLVGKTTHLLVVLHPTLVQQADPYDKVVGVSLALWAPGFICPNNTLWQYRGPIVPFWYRVRISILCILLRCLTTIPAI